MSRHIIVLFCSIFMFMMTNKSANAVSVSTLDIGENVYIKGITGDELATIIRIDTSDNTVKVLRDEDGTAVWVRGSNIISREESTTRDLGRGLLVGIGIICFLDPESCSN